MLSFSRSRDGKLFEKLVDLALHFELLLVNQAQSRNEQAYMSSACLDYTGRQLQCLGCESLSHLLRSQDSNPIAFQ